jgi:bifunctional N-acetylglucosamine-1-phosphate-uridyltransferase/glucosamine-1-phosphate-acetyltransferase GlmU-like protein
MGQKNPPHWVLHPHGEAEFPVYQKAKLARLIKQYTGAGKTVTVYTVQVDDTSGRSRVVDTANYPAKRTK